MDASDRICSGGVVGSLPPLTLGESLELLFFLAGFLTTGGSATGWRPPKRGSGTVGERTTIGDIQHACMFWRGEEGPKRPEEGRIAPKEEEEEDWGVLAGGGR